MANWCQNDLNVSMKETSKEAKEQLDSFKGKTNVPAQIVLKKDIEKLHKKILKENMKKLTAENNAGSYLELAKLPPIDLIRQFSNNLTILLNGNLEINKQDFTFDILLPCPKELLDLRFPDETQKAEMFAKYGDSSWFDWRVNNWGTKWDASDVYTENSTETELVYSFSTAWDAPTVWLGKICEQFPLLRFHLSFSEIGNQFQGEMICEKGEVVENYIKDYVNEQCYTCEDIYENGEGLNDDGECEKCNNLSL